MAKFLNTKKAVSEIEGLIRSADQTLILISPYLKLAKDFRELLQDRNSNDKLTTIIFRKQELNPDEMKFLQSIQFVSLYSNEDLHAKCYLNDSKMIITSLNLYEFSMLNNKEMGVLIDKSDPNDLDLFNEAWNEVDYIKRNSHRFEFGNQKLPAKTQAGKVPTHPGTGNKNGFCIRTGLSIPFNRKKPFSIEAYKTWSQFGDPNYPEKFCHFSGEPSNGETCMAKPILYKNWKKAEEIHGL